ncbi:MAG: hypothetical protein K1X67_19150 [Fimbriimonadaceae bacterium]|nr:hypothetical protein [Fimbriimonadaceae bacterium]
MIVESYEDVIVLSGVLRSNFWDTIHTAISLTLRRHPAGVIIDFSGITECTREGADTFVDAMNFIESHDARIIVAAVPPQVMEVLKSVPEVRSQLPIALSVEEARRSLDLLSKGEDEKKKKKHQADLKKILVCLMGNDSDEHVLKIARKMATATPSEIKVVYPLIVPRDLPLQAPLPQDEAAAAQALGSAQQVFEASGIQNTIQLERARDVPSALADALEEMSPTQVIIGLSSLPSSVDAELKLAKLIMARVSAPLTFVRGPGNSGR